MKLEMLSPYPNAVVCLWCSGGQGGEDVRDHDDQTHRYAGGPHRWRQVSGHQHSVPGPDQVISTLCQAQTRSVVFSTLCRAQTRSSALCARPRPGQWSSALCARPRPGQWSSDHWDSWLPNSLASQSIQKRVFWGIVALIIVVVFMPTG